MEIHELDTVLLKDGREAVVVEVFDKPNRAYMLEFADSYKTDDLPTVTEDEIDKVIHRIS